MNKLRKITILFCILFLFLSTNVCAAEKKEQFELPLNGATGYSITNTSITDHSGTKLVNIKAGTAFTILDSNNTLLMVKYNNTIGFINKNHVLINLPDIIPSIIYENTNSSSSIFTSSGYSLNNITNSKLYNAYFYNSRFGEEKYVMPILYPMAVKIQKAQNLALANGDSLKIYETYRPFDVQMNISSSLTSLMDTNSVVKKGINSNPWKKSWFIATKLSNHQRGKAIDVSLVKINSSSEKTSGNYSYKSVDSYTEYTMPTKMHELSSAAATFTAPINSKDRNIWKKTSLSNGMINSIGAQKLQNYCTNAGLTPLASEWWHFNDLDCPSLGNGNFYLTSCVSEIP